MSCNTGVCNQPSLQEISLAVEHGLYTDVSAETVDVKPMLSTAKLCSWRKALVGCCCLSGDSRMQLPMSMSMSDGHPHAGAELTFVWALI